MLFFIFSFLNFTGNTVLAEWQLTISEAVEYALEHNEEFLLQKKEAALQEKIASQDKYGLSAGLQGTAGYGSLTGTSLVSGLSLQAERELGEGRLTARLDNSLNPARDNILSSSLSFAYNHRFLPGSGIEGSADRDNILRQAGLDLEKNVRQLYLDVMILEKQLLLNQKENQLKKDQLQAARLRQEDEDIIESLQTQLQVAENILELTTAELQSKWQEFRSVLGFPQVEKIMLTEELKIAYQSKDIAYWQELALANSNELLALRQQLEELAAGQGKKVDRSEWQVDVAAGLRNYQLQPERTSQPDFFFEFNVSRNFDLVTGIQEQQKELEIEKKELQLKKAKNMVKNQIYNAYRNFLQVEERIADLNTQKIEKLNQLSVLERKKEAGLVGQLDTGQEQLELLKIEFELFSAYCEARLSYERLKETAGI